MSNISENTDERGDRRPRNGAPFNGIRLEGDRGGETFDGTLRKGGCLGSLRALVSVKETEDR